MLGAQLGRWETRRPIGLWEASNLTASTVSEDQVVFDTTETITVSADNNGDALEILIPDCVWLTALYTGELVNDGQLVDATVDATDDADVLGVNLNQPAPDADTEVPAAVEASGDELAATGLDTGTLLWLAMLAGLLGAGWSRARVAST